MNAPEQASEVTSSLEVRPRVSDVALSDLIRESDDPTEGGYRLVYPSSSGWPLAELRYAGGDLEAWYDGTGYEWPPDSRTQMSNLLRRATTPTKRPEIEDAPPLDHLRDVTIEVLTAANNPPQFFRRGGLVTEIAKNERGVPSAQIVDPVRMRDRLGEIADWHKVGKFGPYSVKPPSDLASNLLVTPGLHLPPLEAIVEHPVLGRDGRIRTRRGYDRGSATFFSPTVPLRGLNVNGHPRIAWSWLSEWLEDFEFSDAADRTNIVALALTPILRPIIDGQVPLAAIRAAKAGNGKSLLAKSVFTILNGRVPPTYSLTSQDDDESDKRLTAILLDAEPVVFLDNIPTGMVLRSAALARALTSPVWKARVIRTSKAPTIPIRCVWIATGNGLTMDAEIARRSYMIELTSSMERPDLRDAREFRHPDLLGWTLDNRESLLSALLSIVNDWVDAGRPIIDGPVLASFENWSTIVGSVLRNAGARHFLGNEDRKRLIAEDDTAIHREVLLRTVWEVLDADAHAITPRFDRGVFSLRDLHATTIGEAAMIEATAPFLPDRLSWDNAKAIVHLGYALRPVVDGIYGGYVLQRAGKSKSGQTFRILKTDR